MVPLILHHGDGDGGIDLAPVINDASCFASIGLGLGSIFCEHLQVPSKDHQKNHVSSAKGLTQTQLTHLSQNSEQPKIGLFFCGGWDPGCANAILLSHKVLIGGTKVTALEGALDNRVPG